MRTRSNKVEDVVILGAGLAGLTAGYVLSRSGTDVLIIERDPTVGGLAKTVNHHGFRFDLGGHRFSANNKKIEHFVLQEVLKDEALVVARSSKIFLRGKYFDYPLQPMNAFFGLGVPTASRVIFDYTIERLKHGLRDTQIISLEDWVVRQFGRTAFNIFFKEYSEKVWGIDAGRVCGEWAAQRIQGLSLGVAIKTAFFKSGASRFRTLASRFHYPPLGIGQIADNLKREVEKDNPIATNTRIVRVNHSDRWIDSVTVQNGDKTEVYRGEEFISSIPLTILVRLLYPEPPADVLTAASRLRYRDLVIVTIMVNRARVTDQSWIYIPEQKIPFGRIHEPTNWSTKMAPDGKTLLVTEHYCFRGDDTWSASDAALTRSTVTNLVNLGFIKRHEVIDSVVLKIPKAYPIFEVGYSESHEKICDYLDEYHNLHYVGRGGSFKYYNTDHAMESGIAAAEEITAKNLDPCKEGREELAPTGTHS